MPRTTRCNCRAETTIPCSMASQDVLYGGKHPKVATFEGYEPSRFGSLRQRAQGSAQRLEVQTPGLHLVGSRRLRRRLSSKLRISSGVAPAELAGC